MSTAAAASALPLSSAAMAPTTTDSPKTNGISSSANVVASASSASESTRNANAEASKTTAAASSASAANTTKPSASTFGRSVVDFETADELQKALETVVPQGTSVQDWQLPTPHDPQTEVRQTLDGELQRLLTLQSYMLLDAQADAQFDKLTQEAREVFGVPTSLISLIDLGRQFFLSNTGGGLGVKETNRNVAFCSYTIQQKDDTSQQGCLVVPDTHDDTRFKDGPLVQGGPKLRFYAGAPLVSPEGHKLGTFCVEGPEPRTKPFSELELKKLQDYAAQTMELMVERRKRLRDRLSGSFLTQELRNHAAVATSLADLLLELGNDTPQQVAMAMRLYQESVQTLMNVPQQSSHSSESGTTTPQQRMTPPPASAASPERQQTMRQLLTLLLVARKNMRQQDANKSTTTTSSPPQHNAMIQQLLDRVVALFPAERLADVPPCQLVDHGISGLFHMPPPKADDNKARHGRRLPATALPPLVFSEVFQIDIRGVIPTMPTAKAFGGSNSNNNNEEEDSITESPIVTNSHPIPLSQMPFTVPLEECSKATLFNMGQVHYHYWGNAETAMQFFHLAASVSHKISPLDFDPVDISCINNMAQIHFQYGQADDALNMLTETLERAHRALAAVYRQTEVAYEEETQQKQQQQADSSDAAAAAAEDAKQPDPQDDSDEVTADAAADRMDIPTEAEVQDALRTTRLRRKIARTMINIAHVHFFQNNLDKAAEYLQKAIPVLDKRTMTGRTLSAIWYNMALVRRRQQRYTEALAYLIQFLQAAERIHGRGHLQNAEALLEKAAVLQDMGRLSDAAQAVAEALQIRRAHLGGDAHVLVAEALTRQGKIMLAREQYKDALTSLNSAIQIYAQPQDESSSTTTATTNNNAPQPTTTRRTSFLTLDRAPLLLDVGQAQHALGQTLEAKATYQTVLDWTRSVLGPDHPFVARIAGIVHNLSSE